MTLYTDIPRTDLGPRNRTEPDYSYENRSARIELQRVRPVLEGWFAAYPVDGQLDLQRRFQSSDDKQHFSAFFELTTHALLRSNGFAVDVHSHTESNRSSRPDFSATRSDGLSFYVECTVLFDSKNEQAARSRTAALYDYLDANLDSPDFFLSIEIAVRSDQPPRLKKITQKLRKLLSTADYSKLREMVEDGKLPPPWIVKDEAWEISFTPIPKSPQARGKPGLRPIGVQFSGAQWVDARTPLLGSLRQKAGRYGQLEKPYMIALNSLSDFLHVPDSTDVVDALFGQEVGQYDPVTRELRPARERNGLWVSSEGHPYGRVSCVAIALQLTPWTVMKSSMMVWHNPWAKHPMELGVWSGDENYVHPSTGRIETKRGLPLSAILGLDENWPFNEPTT